MDRKKEIEELLGSLKKGKSLTLEEREQIKKMLMNNPQLDNMLEDLSSKLFIKTLLFPEKSLQELIPELIKDEILEMKNTNNKLEKYNNQKRNEIFYMMLDKISDDIKKMFNDIGRQILETNFEAGLEFLQKQTKELVEIIYKEELIFEINTQENGDIELSSKIIKNGNTYSLLKTIIVTEQK